jgi:aspartate/methionine/tyrosine aminotransferase
LKPGDEVLVFDPFFELYAKQVALTGAKLRFIPLHLTTDSEGKEAWIPDLVALENSINAKTKTLILNSPHNPTGKVHSWHLWIFDKQSD